jgi:hypothetical protein
MLKVRTLGTIAIVVLALVVVLFDGIYEPVLCTGYILGYFGQIGKLQRATIFLNQIVQRNIVEFQMVTVQGKFLLGEKIGLINKINIFGIHVKNI